MYFNFICVVLIIFSLMFYLYNKTRQLRTPTALEIRHKYYKAKANIWLGAFILTFGVNQIILFSGFVTYAIAGIFIVLGALVIYDNYKRSKHYAPFLQEEQQLYEAAQQDAASH